MSSKRDMISLGIMAFFTTIFFFAEIIVGYAVSSLALISDSFHMLSDLLSLLIAIGALKMSKKSKTDELTYGWVRAEILGGLINGIFLLSLCFNIGIEAIERLFEPVEVTNPVLLLSVAVLGLLFNIVGLFIFSGHAGHSHSTSSTEEPLIEEKSTAMHSVFLHVLGDAFGSIAVVASTLFIWLTDFSWRFYMDPIVSIVLTLILTRSAVRLVKSTSLIILQRVPTFIDVKEIEEEVLKVSGILGIHELHVWQLDDTRNVCTLHVLVDKELDFIKIGKIIKNILHARGVHNVTIQPEFTSTFTSECSIGCKEKECVKRSCCPEIQRGKHDEKYRFFTD